MRLIDADALKNMCFSSGMHDDNCIIYVPMHEVMRYIDTAPTVGGWISVKDKLPHNAEHPGAFCPRYQVMTKYGVTEGWYNPDKGCWYTLVWFYLGRKTWDDIDFERGDIPEVTDKIEVTHWKEMPEPPKEER